MTNKRGPKGKKKETAIAPSVIAARKQAAYKPSIALDKRTQEIYKKKEKEISERFAIAPDPDILARFCACLARIELLEDEIEQIQKPGPKEKDGYQEPGIDPWIVSNDRGVISENPIQRTLDREVNTLLRYGKALGLTPVAVKEIQAAPPAAKGGEVDEVAATRRR